MKTEQEIDALMAQVPASWRNRWCESKMCACMGCVQVGNRLIMAKAFTGAPYRGDPEYISESKIPREIRDQVKITREEWENWKSRQPQQPNGIR